MAFAKGGLAVPLKTFTIQSFAWSNGNPPLSRAKERCDSSDRARGRKGNSDLVGIGNNQHPTSNTQGTALMPIIGCSMLDGMTSESQAPPPRSFISKATSTAFGRLVQEDELLVSRFSDQSHRAIRKKRQQFVVVDELERR